MSLVRAHSFYGPTTSIVRSGFLLLFVLSFCAVFAQKQQKSAAVRYSLTVAHINTTQSKQYAVISFYQSQRFYKLPVHSPQYRSYIQLLRHAQKTNTPLYIYRRSEYSDTIIKVARVPRKP